MTTKPTPPEARPPSAEQFVLDKADGTLADTGGFEPRWWKEMEGYAAHVSKPLADALERLKDCQQMIDVGDESVSVGQYVQAALEKFRKGRE